MSAYLRATCGGSEAKRRSLIAYDYIAMRLASPSPRISTTRELGDDPLVYITATACSNDKSAVGVTRGVLRPSVARVRVHPGAGIVLCLVSLLVQAA